MAQEFFLMLQSNASMDTFPSNTVSDFYNQLPITVRLHPDFDWECALSEVSYTYGHPFILRGELLATVKDIRTNKTTECKARQDVTTIHELHRLLVLSIPNVANVLIENEIFHLELVADQFTSITFPDKITDILGLQPYTYTLLTNIYNVEQVHDNNLSRDENVYTNIEAQLKAYHEEQEILKQGDNTVYPWDELDAPSTETLATEQKSDASVSKKEEPRHYLLYIRGTSPIFPQAGMTKMFIYTPIIKPQILADAYAPCLRQIPYEGTYRKVTTHSFSQLQYRDVAVKEFSTIRIYTASESGDKIPFSFPSLSVTLKFRPKKLPL